MFVDYLLGYFIVGAIVSILVLIFKENILMLNLAAKGNPTTDQHMEYVRSISRKAGQMPTWLRNTLTVGMFMIVTVVWPFTLFNIFCMWKRARNSHAA